jgi:transposase
VKPEGKDVLGIDIGKKNHAAVGVRVSGDVFGPRMMFTNDAPGMDRLERLLLEPLGGPDRLIVAMEGTGHYWMPPYFDLVRRGYDAVVVNPIQTRAKFRSRIRKSKTDKLDAESIARLIFSGDANAARIPEAATFELRMLARHRWRLVDMIGDLSRFAHTLIDRVFPEFAYSLSNPLGPTGRAIIREIGLAPATVAARFVDLAACITRASRKALGVDRARLIADRADRSIGIRRGEEVLVEQLRSVIGLIESIEAQCDPLEKELEKRVADLDSPLHSLGISVPLIATIHGESDPVSDFPHAWQYAAFAGLDPSTFKTGNYTRERQTPISKRGSPYLRRALYLSALALYRTHTDLSRCYRRFRAQNRHHVECLVNVAHKLARIIWRLLSDNRPFRARPPRRKATPETKATARAGTSAPRRPGRTSTHTKRSGAGQTAAAVTPRRNSSGGTSAATRRSGKTT